MPDSYLPLCTDTDPLAHGGTFYRGSLEDGFETFEVQPVRDYVGDREAREVGHPFWSREGRHDRADLAAALTERPLLVSADLAHLFGADLDALPEEDVLALVYARHAYGYADDGPAGWSDDLPLEALGIPAEDGADEDALFRAEVLGEDEDEDEADGEE